MKSFKEARFVVPPSVATPPMISLVDSITIEKCLLENFFAPLKRGIGSSSLANNPLIFVTIEIFNSKLNQMNSLTNQISSMISQFTWRKIWTLFLTHTHKKNEMLFFILEMHNFNVKYLKLILSPWRCWYLTDYRPHNGKNKIPDHRKLFLFIYYLATCF